MEEIKIDTARGMEFSMDDKEMYQDMVQMFVEQKAENVSAITDFFEKQDWENYKIRVHGLKSNARMVGAVQLGDLAEKCEHAARDGDAAFIQANTSELFALYEHTLEALQKIDFAAL